MSIFTSGCCFWYSCAAASRVESTHTVNVPPVCSAVLKLLAALPGVVPVLFVLLVLELQAADANKIKTPTVVASARDFVVMGAPAVRACGNESDFGLP